MIRILLPWIRKDPPHQVKGPVVSDSVRYAVLGFDDNSYRFHNPTSIRRACGGEGAGGIRQERGC